ncbi:hypothetical protein BSIN_0267 [Burkholderia singularis]|uniref:Uncharacterized protein n=1 Tax=Burkholderia singularis TaxID=1503053 RepID=A0A238H4E8_9BURK|nr:hypothetical protein BSIN_0267 [Burkholderia singularis]
MGKLKAGIADGNYFKFVRIGCGALYADASERALPIAYRARDSSA